MNIVQMSTACSRARDEAFVFLCLVVAELFHTSMFFMSYLGCRNSEKLGKYSSMSGNNYAETPLNCVDIKEIKMQLQ